MTIPDYETLMLPVLRHTANGVERIPDMLLRLAAEFGLGEEDIAEVLPSGRTSVLASRAHWARTYMSKAGLVRPLKRGHFVITPQGEDLLAEEPARIDNAVLARFPAFAAWKARSARRKPGEGISGEDVPSAPFAEEPVSAGTPKERIDAARSEIVAALSDDIMGRLMEGSPDFFEKAVVALLVSMGYGRGRDGAGQRLGRSGDGGIDGIINEDALGLDAVYVQAKRYAAENTVGRPAIQQFIGSLTGEGASKGVFVTTSAFSAGARDYVAKIPQRVVLIDGQEFAGLMIAHGVGVRPVETIVLSEIDENFFAEE